MVVVVTVMLLLLISRVIPQESEIVVAEYA